MNPVGPGSERNIDPIVDDKRNSQRHQSRFNGARRLDHGAAIAFLVAQLHKRRSARRNGAGEVEQIVPPGALGIENGVQPQIEWCPHARSFKDAVQWLFAI